MPYKELLRKIDSYAKVIREHRPLTPDEVKELDSYFRIGMTYSSNALEGNSLTLSETKVLLEDGITVGGKPIRDCYEATGHAQAYDYMLQTARGGPLQFREEDILRLHALFYSGIDPDRAGCYRTGQVFITGTEYIPPAAEEVPGQIAELVEELNQKKDTLHPVLLAAYAHRRLVDIHPFQDGNGRVGRLLMFKECLRNNIVPFIISDDLKVFYYRGLQHWGTENGYLTDTCLTAQDRFKQVLTYFKIPYEE